MGIWLFSYRALNPRGNHVLWPLCPAQCLDHRGLMNVNWIQLLKVTDWMKACLVLPEHFRSSTVSSPTSSMFPSWCVSNFALDSPLPTQTLSPKFPTLEMVLNLPNHLKPKIWVSINFLLSSFHIIYQNIWLPYLLNISSSHPPPSRLFMV